MWSEDFCRQEVALESRHLGRVDFLSPKELGSGVI